MAGQLFSERQKFEKLNSPARIVNCFQALEVKYRRLMMNKGRHIFHTLATIFMLIVLMGLVTTSCGFKINGSLAKFDTGPTQTTDIQIPMPSDPAAAVDLTLEFVAGKLILAPGDGAALVSGAATYNVAEFEPKIETAGSAVSLHQGALEAEGFPGCPDDVKNEWNLKIANTPMNLTSQAGAYDGEFELGGLSLQKLVIMEGGSDVTSTFSTPNHVEMTSFEYSTGASDTNLRGLANANFTNMHFQSGAGEYTLSFDGELKRDGTVVIDSGLGTLNIIVPDGTAAVLTFQGGLSTINVGSGWVKNGDVYTHAANSPALNITLNMGAGTLNL